MNRIEHDPEKIKKTCPICCWKSMVQVDGKEWFCLNCGIKGIYL